MGSASATRTSAVDADAGGRAQRHRDGTGAPDDGEDEDEDEVDEDKAEASEAPVVGREPGWALRDVSFAPAAGEALGLAGLNGAGKTTLLKVLARVTPPTEGRVAVHGRVAPLIESAAAFIQPDMTARQNVRLLGRLPGVPHAVVERRTEDVLRFAELEDRDGEKAKNLSTGLLRRLSFATTIELEPVVLIVDDVLGVGDASYREKCVLRVAALRRRGMALLFASHDLDSLADTCDRVAWLEAGRIRELGPASEILERYNGVSDGAKGKERTEPASRPRPPEAPRLSESAARAISEPLERDSPQQAEPVPEPPPVLPVAPTRAQPTRPAQPQPTTTTTVSAGERAAARREARRRRHEVSESLSLGSARADGADGEPLELVVGDNDGPHVRFELRTRRAALDVRCSTTMWGNGAPRFRAMQPAPVRLEVPGQYEVAIDVPAGVLPDGDYEGRVRVLVHEHSGVVNVLRDRAFLFAVEGSSASAPEEADPEPLLDIPWSIARRDDD